eukprot:2466888-Rhodomonas_salina.1
MSGTDLACDDTSYQQRERIRCPHYPGRSPLYRPMPYAVLTSYAIRGTDLGYAATRSSRLRQP